MLWSQRGVALQVESINKKEKSWSGQRGPERGVRVKGVRVTVRGQEVPERVPQSLPPPD